MKADTPVEKLKNSFSTGACKTLRVSHSFHRLDDDEPKTTKTGHFTCYRNRTFSFATDTAGPHSSA